MPSFLSDVILPGDPDSALKASPKQYTDKRMRWVPYTGSGQFFEKNDVTRYGQWTMVANKATTQDPYPTDSGPQVDLLGEWSPSLGVGQATYTVKNTWTLATSGRVDSYGTTVLQENVGYLHTVVLKVGGTVVAQKDILPGNQGDVWVGIVPVQVSAGNYISVETTVTTPGGGVDVYWQYQTGWFDTAPVHCSSASGSKDNGASTTTAYQCNVMFTPGTLPSDWDVVSYTGSVSSGGGSGSGGIGEAPVDGTPYERQDGGWVAASAGPPGDSAYQVWLDEGNTGTEQDFLDSLVGSPGPTAVSADAGNASRLGTDNLIYTPDSGGGGLSRSGKWTYNPTGGGAAPTGTQFTTSDGNLHIQTTWLRFDDADLNGNDHRNYLLLAIKQGAKVLVQMATSSDDFAIFNVTGTPTDGGTYVEIPVAFDSQAGAVLSWQVCLVDFLPAGTPAGAAGGDLSGTYPNPSVVDDSHAHTGATVSALDAGDITTGTFALARIPTGTTASTVSLGNHTHSNALDQATADGLYVNVTGDKMSGTLQVPTINPAPTTPAIIGTSMVPANGEIYFGTTSRAITVPAGVVAGDMLLLLQGHFSGSLTAFSQANGFSTLPGGSNVISNGRWWYRIADASTLGGQSLTFTTPDSSVALLAMVAVRGAGSVAFSADGGTGASTPSNPSSSGDRLLISTYLGVNGFGTVAQNPAPTTGETELVITDQASPSDYLASLSLGTRLLSDGQSVPVTTWTAANPGGHGLHVMTLLASALPLTIDTGAAGTTFGGAVTAAFTPTSGSHLVNKTYLDTYTQKKIPVGTTAPANPAVNDLWVDTSG